ncbi:MAG: helix-turn-helix transcriptional regulator [Planctomycetota bacterium]
MKLESDLMRGAGPVAVLKLLEAGPKYGYELVQALDLRSDGVLNMGQSTLYPLLYNLEAKGFIKPEWRTAETGRKRKYYHLTPKGEKRLASASDQWSRLAAAMVALGIVAPEAGGK